MTVWLGLLLRLTVKPKAVVPEFPSAWLTSVMLIIGGTRTVPENAEVLLVGLVAVAVIPVPSGHPDRERERQRCDSGGVGRHGARPEVTLALTKA